MPKPRRYKRFVEATTGLLIPEEKRLPLLPPPPKAQVLWIVAEELAKPPGRDWLESRFQARLVKAAERLNFTVYFTKDSRGSPDGYPDLTMARQDTPPLWAELKSATGRIKPKQQFWHDLLRSGGQRAFFWWPWHWEEAIREISGVQA